ncbi:DUF2929 family protein [Bacillus aquiflavi]|uniref:DUF2929 family protein n=1 Tax=Bacillus aquiflavi TaxID=2672567 RepID=A0A6B3VWX7_9BACI|nr:DUF2929 family protein [Bacillus aquiflavi]MBA4536467.1 DUF2929 family protein [Bacillus aquiflavi]NEY80835.1 DUF2929 family protein [Bacillus aquiflavi]UAC49074.1 YjzD family protein [Bacillus aquiflavi]
MHFFWTFFWTFLLSHLLTYVVSSMSNVAYDFKSGSILGIALSFILFFIPLVLPNGPSEKEGLH